jgi:hypothetical protein
MMMKKNTQSVNSFFGLGGKIDSWFTRLEIHAIEMRA